MARTRSREAPAWADGEARSEDGVPLDTYSHVLPGMQEKAVNAIAEVLTGE